MRWALTLTLSFLVAAPLPALAQVRPKPEAPDARPSRPEKPPLTVEQSGAEADRKALARQRAWDSKMRRTMGGICTGC